MFAVRTVLNKRALATSAASSLLLSGITSVGNDENKKFAFCEGNGTGGADEWLEKFKAMGDDLAKTAGGKVQSAVGKCFTLSEMLLSYQLPIFSLFSCLGFSFHKIPHP